MAVHYRTQGFVLKKTDLWEADQVFSIYTQDFGKLEILGKAIRKIKSKLRSGAELFYLSETEFIQGKTYKTLTDAVVIDKFKNIRSDLKRLKIVYQVAETADNLISGQEKDEKIWNLLKEVFEKLNDYKLQTINPSTPSSGPRGYPLIYHYFVWNLLSILGYQIDLYNCTVCQKKLVLQKLYFNPEEGGIICEECLPAEASAKEGEISPDIIKILRLLLKKDWNILSRLKVQDLHKKELESISENYISFYKQGA